MIQRKKNSTSSSSSSFFISFLFFSLVPLTLPFLCPSQEDQMDGCDVSSFQDQISEEQKGIDCATSSEMADGHGFCAICLEKIPIQETALVKGCEHAYCVTCILRWATYKEIPCCPQCKHPFQFLNVHRSLDGCIHDYMFEESICLLLRATWFVPLSVEAQEDVYDEVPEDIYQYEDDDDDLEDSYFNASSSSLRIGNRRWGDGGYVRAGRKQARPVDREQSLDSDAGPSHGPRKNKEASKDVTGRRAKRALKREAADKAAAAKHQQHLQRLGRK